ncbi:MAG TPA: hypothetical protein VNH46_14035, partial [Gemmatimonadales bacterium]|nr:hypothetical protein [Gemmatimonadales bacterium]
GAGLSQAGLAVVVAIGLGAYGGTAWGVTSHFARPAFSRYGRVGDYLTGLAVAAGTGLAFAAPAAALDLDPFFRTALGWGLLAIGVVLIGLVLGHRVFRSPVAPPGA